MILYVVDMTYLKHFSYPLSTPYKDLFDIAWNSSRWWDIVSRATGLHEALKASILHNSKRSHVFGNPTDNLRPVIGLASFIWRIRWDSLSLSLCMLPMWVRHSSLVLSSLKQCSNWSITQPWLRYNTARKLDILCRIRSLHNVITPTYFCMLSKVTCRWRITLINKAIYVSRRFPFPFATLRNARENMRSSAIEVLNLRVCLEEGIDWCIPSSLEAPYSGKQRVRFHSENHWLNSASALSAGSSTTSSSSSSIGSSTSATDGWQKNYC